MQPNEESNYQTSLDQMQSVFGIKLAPLEKKKTLKKCNVLSLPYKIDLINVL